MLKLTTMSKEIMEKNFRESVERDTIKNSFCKNNGIKILRISYKKFKEIEKIVTNWINSDAKISEFHGNEYYESRQTIDACSFEL